MLVLSWLLVLSPCVSSSVALCINGHVDAAVNGCYLDGGTIVGIVIGGIVALILLAAVVLLACSHLRLMSGIDLLEDDVEGDGNVSYSPTGATVVTIRQPPEYRSDRQNQTTNTP